MILWAFEYIAHVGLFFPLQKMLVLKSRKYQISDSDNNDYINIKIC